jgi:hypothetical protein
MHHARRETENILYYTLHTMYITDDFMQVLSVAPSIGSLLGGSQILIRIVDFVGAQTRHGAGLPTLEWAHSGREAASVEFVVNEQRMNGTDVRVEQSAAGIHRDLPVGWKSYDITVRCFLCVCPAISCCYVYVILM